LRSPGGGEAIDRAGVIWLPGPATATGEDMAELHIHGSDAVASLLFRILSSFDGVRMAEPGEFTRRGFINGKLDLVEAEGLSDLLAARTEAQRRQAIQQFLGGSSAIIESWRSRLIASLAAVDAVVEFSDEGDMAGVADEAWRSDARALIEDMQRAVARAGRAESLRRGLRVVLAGAPNTGKSSLLNALAERDVAIVSPLAGTTRDSIEVLLDLEGVPVVLTDTAGLRDSPGDDIEREGMARTRRFAEEADLVVWLWSRDVAGSEDVMAGVKPDVVVETKCDLAPGPAHGRESNRISTVSGAGMLTFVNGLSALVKARVGLGETAVIVRERQIQAVNESIRFLNDALSQPPGALELVSADLRGAATSLARLTGRIDVEDWLDDIFSRFCIGK
jgi:tRNA modification GTPase